MSREFATELAFSLGKIAFSPITLGGIGLVISTFQIFWRVSLPGWALVFLASRSLQACTAFTVSAGRQLPIFRQLLDRGLGRILPGFLSQSFRIGLISPVILSRMRLGTVSVTKGQTNGTVFRLRIFYILRSPTFRWGILAQSFIELLMICISQSFQLLPQRSGCEAENPRFCHEPSSFKGDTSVNHFIKIYLSSFSANFNLQAPSFFLHFGGLVGEHFLRAYLTWKRPEPLGNPVTSVHQDFTFLLDRSCLSDAALSAGILAKMMAYNSPSDRCLQALSASFTKSSKRCRLF